MRAGTGNPRPAAARRASTEVPAGRLPRATVLTALLLAAALAAVAGCASNPAPAEPKAAAGRPLPAGEPTGTAVGESAAEPEAGVAEDAPPADGTVAAAGTAPSAPAADAPADDPTVVTIEPAGGRAAEPRTLAEAAEAARARRGDRPKATTVITNENLAEWAAGGQVTLVPEPAGDPEAADAASGGGAAAGAGAAGSSAADAGATGSGGAAAAPAGDPAGSPGTAPGSPASDPDAGPAGPRDEAYWREQARELRTRWGAAAEEIERLEKEAADLRWAFYAEDDPYYRDERIKPSWDRALDELRRARQDERYFRDQVEELMEEGRRAGALPGWLREGVELEPEDHGDSDAPIGREPRSTEPIEPPTTERERPR